jgi:uncharacterized protein (TIGR00645 family)
MENKQEHIEDAQQQVRQQQVRSEEHVVSSDTVDLFYKMKSWVELVLFVGPKLVLIVFYFVAFFALIVYGYANLREFVHCFGEMIHESSQIALLIFLELLDMLMIANLGQMLISGSYNSFVSKKHRFAGENVGSGLLKVKMSTSMQNVVGIGLAKAAAMIVMQLVAMMHLGGKDLEMPATVSWGQLLKLGFVYGLFASGSYGLAIIDHLHGQHELEAARLHEHEEHRHC